VNVSSRSLKTDDDLDDDLDDDGDDNDGNPHFILAPLTSKPTRVTYDSFIRQMTKMQTNIKTVHRARLFKH